MAEPLVAYPALSLLRLRPHGTRHRSAPSVLLLQGHRLLRRQSVLLGEDGPLRDHRDALDHADAHLHPLETLDRRGGTAPTGDEIPSVRRFIHIELGLLALMPLMAVLMARGIGR